MGNGTSHFFDKNVDTAGNLAGTQGDDNLNSLDVGAAVYQMPGTGNELKVNVRPLSYGRQIGANPEYITFAGTTGVSLTANATNRIWLNASNAIAVSASAFPDPEDTDHLRLAIVVTNTTIITGFTDSRPKMRMQDRARVPSFAVASLPAAPTGFPLAHATDGLKLGETPGAGSGVLVYWDGTAWRRCADDTTAAA